MLNPDPRTSGQFEPDEIDAAHQRLVEASNFLSEMPSPDAIRPSRMPADQTSAAAIGTASCRCAVEFPWFADMKESPSELARAVERQSGPAYHRLLQSAAEYEVSSRQATQSVMKTVAPDLDQLVEQVRGMDPELAQILADAGAGKLGVFDGSLRRAREWAERHVADAKQIAELSNAIDDAGRIAQCRARGN